VPDPHTVEFTQLASADLVVDRIYRGGTAGNAGDDPLARLLPVGNQGGFRTEPVNPPEWILAYRVVMETPDRSK
jgi:hypothetical protein